MEFEIPNENGFTIYSKSGCPNCSKTKTILKEKKIFFNVIDCDDYLIEDKLAFLEFIAKIANQEYKTFPIVFNDNKFIGGYNETKQIIDKLFITFEESDNF